MTGSFVLGIDPAKRKFTACVLSPEGTQVLAARDFDATRAGFDDLLGVLATLVPAKGRLVVAIEASGTLDDNLLALFSGWKAQFAVRLLRIDSAQSSRFASARPIRGKTDRADARRIAEFARTYAAQLDAFESDAEALAAGRLANERLALAGERAALRCRIQDRLAISFPEFERVLPGTCGALALAVLAQVPTAAHVVRKRATTLAGIRSDAHGKHLGEERAQRMLALARESIASATSEHDGSTIRRLVARLQLVEAQIAETEHQLAAYAKSDPLPETPDPDRPLTVPQQIAIVDTLPGVAVVGASAIVLRSRGLARFVSAKALAAQLGTCPAQSQTGSSKNTSALTSRGDRRGRAVLYLLTLTACAYDPAMGFHKWRHLQAGLTPKQAVCACMNRYARLMWTVVRNQTRYDRERAVENARRHHPELWKQYEQEQPGSCGERRENTPAGALT